MSSSTHGYRHEPATGRWAVLPRDLLVEVFLKLGPREVMLGAEFACRAWRCAALEEPSLWRRVGREQPIDKTWRWVSFAVESAMSSAAVDRAAGQCEEFTGSFYDEEVILLVQRAPFLKSLSVVHYSQYESGAYLVVALQKLTVLEDLQIYFEYGLGSYQDMLESVCEACPQLKKLVLNYASAFQLGLDEDDEYRKEPIDGPIPVMRNLHTLELDECDLSCNGLNAILDSCPLLQTLSIYGYFNQREMGKELRKKCARVKNLNLLNRSSPNIDKHYDNYRDGI
ncbi:unnamed protein product [Urochloa decumbens]|uniref:F-box domain-containing protein n=1 Tax=Urochloa decumbens TaxID=240449 RepID=A0ABC9BXU4_9POAL